MTPRLTPEQFHAADGVADWRVVFAGACAVFVTESYADGFALVEAIGTMADEAGQHLELDLRRSAVTVTVRSHALGALTERDLTLAQQVSRIAHKQGVSADPSRVQTVQVAIDAHVPAHVLPFWRAVLGYDPAGDEDLVDPRGRGPSLWFQEMSPARSGRNRLHIDVCVPPDQAEARIAAAVAAGGRVVYDANAPAWWTLADPEGNEVDVATMMGRG